VPTDVEYLYCALCGQESLFEAPPCPDGHGADCPERLCTDCGHLLLIGPVPVDADRPGHSSGRRVA
jgi:hypothetical protein